MMLTQRSIIEVTRVDTSLRIHLKILILRGIIEVKGAGKSSLIHLKILTLRSIVEAKGVGKSSLIRLKILTLGSIVEVKGAGKSNHIHPKILTLGDIIELTRAETRVLFHIQLKILIKGIVEVNIIVNSRTITVISLILQQNEISKFLYIMSGLDKFYLIEN